MKKYSTVSEFDSGMGSRNGMPNNKSINRTFKRPISSVSESESTKKPFKIIKKNMDIFD